MCSYLQRKFLQVILIKKKKNTMKILIADDSKNIRELIITILNSSFIEIQIIECNDGAEVLNYMSDNQPDVVLLDIMMGEINGFDVLRNVKPTSASTIFIMVSQLKGEEYQILAKELGAEKFINKEDLWQLPEVINQLLKDKIKSV